MDAFYNEMLEKINNAEVTMHGKIIQEKEVKNINKAYTITEEKKENIDKK